MEKRSNLTDVLYSYTDNFLEALVRHLILIKIAKRNRCFIMVDLLYQFKILCFISFMYSKKKSIKF